MFGKRSRISITNFDLHFLLLTRIHFPWLMYPVRTNLLQFRYPASDKSARGVMIHRLFYRIIYPNRIDTGNAGLHLQLAVMYPRFIIRKHLRQMIPSLAPVQPKIITRETYKHCAHTEGNPSIMIEITHTSVNKRIAGHPIFPGIIIILIMLTLPQAFKKIMHAFCFY